MIDSEFPHPRVTRLARRRIGTHDLRVALLRAAAACTAQLGQSPPRGHANQESIIEAVVRSLRLSPLPGRNAWRAWAQ
jgi:hypothetical protein